MGRRFTLRALIFILGIFSVSLFQVGDSFARDREQELLAYKIKAAFTYNFIKLVDWQNSQNDVDDSPLSITVVGEGPFYQAISAYQNKKVLGRAISVRLINSLDEVDKTDVLFFSLKHSGEIKSFSENPSNAGVLTLGESDAFLSDGGIIKFLILDDSVNFEVNLKKAKESRLQLSYKLLNQALKVKR